MADMPVLICFPCTGRRAPGCGARCRARVREQEQLLEEEGAEQEDDSAPADEEVTPERCVGSWGSFRVLAGDHGCDLLLGRSRHAACVPGCTTSPAHCLCHAGGDPQTVTVAVHGQV